MVDLEENLCSISAASDSVSNSLSARRGQLEKLNGSKKNLTKLQFLMELPSRLQRCVREEEHELAVADFRKALRILQAVGHVASFQGIQDEATLIMKRLSQALGVQLLQPDLADESLGVATRLRVLLDGHEDALLTKYLARRRRTLFEVLNSFSPSTARIAAAEHGGLSGGAHSVAQLGAAFVPQLVLLHDEWQRLFAGESAKPALPEQGVSAAPVPAEKKEAMLLKSLQELTGGFIEICRRLLQAERVEPERLLQGLRQLVAALDELHRVVPHAKLVQRASRAAERLAKSSMDLQVQALQQRLAACIEELRGADAYGPPGALQEQVHAAVAAIASHVLDAVSASGPLLVPLCELLGLRADSMAMYLVSQLHTALFYVGRTALHPTSRATGLLVRAGLCLQMASTGVLEVAVVLKAQLSVHGLAGAALVFDSRSIMREMQLSADSLLERFVEVQAQGLSLEVSQHMQTMDWLHTLPPHEVTHLIEVAMLELHTMQALAAQVLPGESRPSMLPLGACPATASALQFASPRSCKQLTTTAIQKDLQRMFARKISFSANVSRGTAATSHMLTRVAKLALKTLTEEVRLATFCRAGFQQVQVDCGMLRWVLPPCVGDEGAILALLDEALVSCQERCLDPVPFEQNVIEVLCEAKRKVLRLNLAVDPGWYKV